MHLKPTHAGADRGAGGIISVMTSAIRPGACQKCPWLTRFNSEWAPMLCLCGAEIDDINSIVIMACHDGGDSQLFSAGEIQPSHQACRD